MGGNMSLKFFKPKIKELAMERIRGKRLAEGEKIILQTIVKLQRASVMSITQESKKNGSYVSRVLRLLLERRLVVVEKEKTQRIYSPSIDAKIAYVEE
jgi:hypothetical protein